MFSFFLVYLIYLRISGAQFTANAGERAATAKERGLDRQCHSLLQNLCLKYDDLQQVSSNDSCFLLAKLNVRIFCGCP